MKKFAKVLLAGAFWGMAVAAWAKPDLVISSITLSTSKAIPGTKITIDSVTRNNGDATGWWKYCDVYYYWGTAGNLKARQIGTGATPNYQEVNGIDKGEEEEDSLSWTIPEGTTPGIYYITCVADAEYEIDESNEGNNTKSVKFTVQGTPAFSDLKWLQPLDVSSNDWVSAYGECANLSTGRTVTLEVWQSKTGFDSQVATYTTKVQYSGGTYYFNRSMKASWASGKYYFKASATEGSYSCEGDSGEADGVMLVVSNDRMVPSYSTAKNDFYYDNDSGSGSSVQGASSGKVALTDDRIPIILVHGMSGDGKPKTLNYWYGWMNADSSATLGYFNQSPLSSMFRVYRYVYDSRDNISTNGKKFADFVNSFYNRHPEFNGRQVVIMAHSMGGLVSRYAMNHDSSFAAKVHRLVTLGSPHLGAQGANPTWIKYSGPDDNSWFVSSIYNTFNLHNNTAGCFDLAWYATNEIPKEALTEDAIAKMGDSYRTDLMRKSLQNPFTGWADMRSKSADNKCVLFGGSSTNEIKDTLRKNWPDDPSGEVKTDHLGLWVATKIYRSMSYADGTGVGDNDGLVPLISALMNDSLKCALASDKNGHPTAAKFNLNAMDGQQVDHASYLDVPVTMDAVKAVLLTQVRGYCQPAAVTNAARWRLIDNVTGETSPWQRTTVRLPALVPGRSYTVNFKYVDGYTTPKDVTFTATKSVTRQVSGTYLTAAESNHAPSGLSLSNASVEENKPIGTVVGTLSAHDEDTGDTLSYALVAGDGDTGNACFTIDGNKLKTAQVFDYEQYPKHYCRIRVSDSNGGYSDEEFTIDVIDVDERTPAQETGDAWLNLSWPAVPGADYYELDVTAGTMTTSYELPKEPLGTNEFLSGQVWRYEAPGGATTTTKGSVTNSPCWFSYGNGTTNAHALFGTNNIALVTDDLPMNGGRAITIEFQNANWNGGGTAAVSRVDAYYRVNGGDWQFIGYNQSTAPRDGGETNYVSEIILFPENTETVAFKLAAPNASRDLWQRGPYVTEGTAKIWAQPDFESESVHLEGYPLYLNTTNYQVANLPADTLYCWHVKAHVGDDVIDLGYGRGLTDTTVPAPIGLSVTTASSTALTATWTDPGLVDHFEVEVTSVVASGTPKDISVVPNIYLRNSDNTSGWVYSTNHTPTTTGSLNSWFVSTTNTEWDYHVLLGAKAPGIQSPTLNLSGYESATLRFVARARASADGVTSKPMVLSYSLDGGQTWTDAASATTNTIYLRNNNYIYLDLPSEAMTSSVKIELSCPESTSNLGNGVRNVTLQAVGKAAPDYEAETAFALENVPAPLANAVAPETTTAATTPTNLAVNTLYYVHVRSVDSQGHVSAWVEASAMTADASAPTGLSLSSRSIHEYNDPGEYVGQLSAEDSDEGDVVTYELTDGDADNALFELSGAVVRAKETFVRSEGATRHIRVRATDAYGKSTEETFEIEVLERATPPTDVLLPTATIAEMGRSSGIEITQAIPGADDSIGLAWNAVEREGARAAPRYFVYYSTNLMQGFYFLKAVDNTNTTVEPLDAPATFWRIMLAD